MFYDILNTVLLLYRGKKGNVFIYLITYFIYIQKKRNILHPKIAYNLKMHRIYCILTVFLSSKVTSYNMISITYF